MSDTETVASGSAGCVSEQLFMISRMEDTFWAIVLLHCSCKTHGELSVSVRGRGGMESIWRHRMASQNSCSGILGIERSPKLLAIPSIIIRGACLTKERGEGGGSSVGIDKNKLHVSILDRAPVPFRLCVTAHSCEGSSDGGREASPEVLFLRCKNSQSPTQDVTSTSQWNSGSAQGLVE